MDAGGRRSPYPAVGASPAPRWDQVRVVRGRGPPDQEACPPLSSLRLYLPSVTPSSRSVVGRCAACVVGPYSRGAARTLSYPPAARVDRRCPGPFRTHDRNRRRVSLGSATGTACGRVPAHVRVVRFRTWQDDSTRPFVAVHAGESWRMSAEPGARRAVSQSRGVGPRRTARMRAGAARDRSRREHGTSRVAPHMAGQRAPKGGTPASVAR